MKVLNKSVIRAMMDNPPKAQRIYEAFNEENWDVLSTPQLEDLLDKLTPEFIEIENKLKQLIAQRYE